MRKAGMLLIAAMLAAGAFFCCIPVAQAAWSGGVEISDWYGDGSAESFVIDTEDELAGLAVVVNGTDSPVDGFTGQDSFAGKTVTLGANIDLTGHDWMPIGNQAHPFGGTFNGNEHSISGLSIGSADVPDATLKQLGLFGYANEMSSISYLIMDNTVIYSSLGTDDDFVFIGALAGISKGTINNCQSSGVVRGAYKSTVGGLVGEIGNSDGIGGINDCQSSITVTSGDGPSVAGGLVGRADRIQISGSSANGLVTCGSSIGATGAPFSGGFIGSASLTTISGCWAEGQVRGGDGSLVGGFCGYNDGSISDSDASGGAMGGINATVGGFMGISLTTDDDVIRCHATGTAEVNNAVSGRAYVGGFVGRNSGGTMTDCSASGNINGGEARADVGSEVTAALYAGGFAGYIEGDFMSSNAVKNCTSSGSIIVDGALFSTDCSDSTAYLYAGGFAGYLDCARVEHCGATAQDAQISAGAFVLSGSGNSGGVYAGGFAGMAFGSQRVGYIRRGIIINCYTRARADAYENANLGGFAGGCIVQDDEYGIEYTSFPLIYNSYTTSLMLCYASENVGGFVGYLQNANIVNSYAACVRIPDSSDPVHDGGFAGSIGTYDGEDLLINTYYDSGSEDSDLESDAVGLNTSGVSVQTKGLRGALMRGETTGSIAYHNGARLNEASNFLEALNGGIDLVNNLAETISPDILTWQADSSSVNRDYPVFGDKWEAPTPVIADADNNTVSVNPSGMALGSLTAITAVGDRQNADGVMLGDMRYIPVSWSSNESGTSKGTFTFAAGSYMASYTPSAAGTYTVTASFRLQGWNGESWENAPDGYPGATDTKTAALTVSTGLALPTVNTGDVSGVTASAAKLSGNVTASSSATITERGFVYGASQNPVIGASGVVKVAAGNGLGSFSADISGLAANTTYHVRAYAVNSAGTSYGTDVAFSTLPMISGLPDSETIYTGSRFTLSPSPAGGVWQWDSAYVTLSESGGTVEIKGIKIGTTIVSYTVGGVSKSITVIILASELPQTGQNFMWVWMLGGASFAAAGTSWLIWRRKAIRQ